jgi:hypothetical protein
MKSAVNTSGPRATLKQPRKHEDLAAGAQRIHDAIANEPRMANASPDMVTFQQHIDAYVVSIKNAKGKQPNAVAQRSAARSTLRKDVNHLLDAVQKVVETIPNPADAAAFIVSMGFKVRKQAKFSKLPLEATHGELPGTVLLMAKAIAAVATYYWQYSLDQKTWVDAGDTLTASTLLTGLTSAQTYYFRFRARARTRSVGFCQPFALIVH